MVLLNHLDNITRNQDVLGCSEISMLFLFRIIWTEKLPGAEKFKYKKLMSFSVKNLISFSVHGGTEKDAGLWFATWVSAQSDTMPNVYR